jgi:hypothetical protein
MNGWAFSIGMVAALASCSGNEPARASPPIDPGVAGTWSVSGLRFDGIACSGAMVLSGANDDVSGPMSCVGAGSVCVAEGDLELNASGWSGVSGTVSGVLGSATTSLVVTNAAYDDIGLRFDVAGGPSEPPVATFQGVRCTPGRDPKAIAAVGSSSTANAHISPASDRYPEKLGAMLGSPWTVTNLGRGGILVSEMAARWRAGAPCHRYGVVIALAGMGDYQNGDAAATITEKLAPWFDSIRAEGRRLVVVTLVPANDEPPACAVRQTVNSWLSAYCARSGATCVDGAAVIADPEDPCRMLPEYDAGNKHYNAGGAEALATAVRTAFP